MSRLGVRDLTVTGGAPPARLGIRDLTITGSAAGAKLGVRNLTITGSLGMARLGIRDLWITGGTLGSLLALAGGGRTVSALTTQTLDARASTGPPDTYSWVQVANGAPTIPLDPDTSGNGSVRTIASIPALLNGSNEPIGYDAVFELTVTKGLSTDTDQATISVLPYPFWDLPLAGPPWIPARIAFI